MYSYKYHCYFCAVWQHIFHTEAVVIPTKSGARWYHEKIPTGWGLDRHSALNTRSATWIPEDNGFQQIDLVYIINLSSTSRDSDLEEAECSQGISEPFELHG